MSGIAPAARLLRQQCLAASSRQLAFANCHAPMDLALKAALTALVVSSVLVAARVFGDRMAGLLAGLPVSTVPALVWVGAEQGPVLAAQLAVGSVAGCGVVAVFALVYERSARHAAPWRALVAALSAMALAMLLIALPAHALGPSPSTTLLAVIAVCAIVLRFMPAPGAGIVRPTASRHRVVCTALLAGAVSAAVATCGLAVSPMLAGFLAALPIVCVATVTAEHSAGGALSVTRFLRGYIVSLMARAAFGSAFATLVLSSSLVPALLTSLALGCACCIVGNRCVR